MGIYYIGYRETDIAANFEATETDDFFSGSITCYGSNEKGNIAYNVISGIQFPDTSFYDERNNGIYKKFISEQCYKILEKDPDALFLPYSVYFASKIPDTLKDKAICCNDERVLQFLNSKINFKKFIDGKLQQANFELMKGIEVIKRIKDKTIPNKKEVVVQAEFGAGGEGTYLCTQSNMADKSFYERVLLNIQEDETYVVSDYIHNICSVSAHMQISDDEIGIYPPGIQILNGPQYIGSDIYAFSQLDDDIKEECMTVTRKLGELIRDMDIFPGIRNRGYFGLNAVISKSGTPRVYVVETNPRYTGSAGLLNILSHKAGIGSIYEHSYRCFKGDKVDFSNFQKIIPNGRKRYAKVERDTDGTVSSLDGQSRNQEGLDKTAYQEEGLYTHAVFEEIKKYNTFDDRADYTKYIANKKL